MLRKRSGKYDRKRREVDSSYELLVQTGNTKLIERRAKRIQNQHQRNCDGEKVLRGHTFSPYGKNNLNFSNKLGAYSHDLRDEYIAAKSGEICTVLADHRRTATGRIKQAKNA